MPGVCFRTSAVIVDEIHAFAGDDRGWHLLSVLERMTRLAGREFRESAFLPPWGTPNSWLIGSLVRAQAPRDGVPPR